MKIFRAVICVSLFLFGEIRAQSFTTRYESELINGNFIIEYHDVADRNFKECIYLIQFDTLMPRLELHFSSKRDLEYFNNYLYCFLSECHRDQQPLLFPGFGKVIFRKDLRAYTLYNNASVLFTRRSFVQFVRAVKKRDNKKTRRAVSQGWQRLKIKF